MNRAYQELADLGLNFTGSYQDEALTRQRMKNANVYLLYNAKELVALISISVKEDGTQTCLYVNQPAVHPDRKRQGLGSHLLDFAEFRALAAGIKTLRLDTATPAHHLVSMYRRRGFSVVAELQWDGKTYRSYLMEKQVCKGS
ncbi:MAG: GNAT family N-acetyltransferase [Pseudobdellovibrionaceae bacterium]|nr:GNAT family N-acetyltransferase [Pseudobdellovibrionaceae bacterium]